MQIKQVKARSIKDSRGNPTIEVSVNSQKASAPAGKSIGKAETPPYKISLKQSIKDINSLNFSGIKINSFKDLSLIESKIKEQFKLKDVKKFGANALVSLEIAILKALAKEKNLQLYQIINPKSHHLPIPVGNAVGGGLHSHNKNSPNFQEFLLIPNKKTINENIAEMNKVYNLLEQILRTKQKNDEGAWQTSFSDEQILRILSKQEIRIGLDIAPSSFFKNGFYNYKIKSLNTSSQIFYINYLIKKYSLFYIEDPLNEDDFESFSKIIRSDKNLVVGDDLTATQISRLKKAIADKSINATIIKPNQNGSLLELEKIFQLCKKHKIKTILSHRSGETLDTALADLAVGFGADFIKCGISTKWREVKLKRLIEIEKIIKK